MEKKTYLERYLKQIVSKEISYLKWIMSNEKPLLKTKHVQGKDFI